MDQFQELADSLGISFNLQAFFQQHPAFYQLLYGILAVVLPMIRGCYAPDCVEGEFEPRMYRHIMTVGEEQRCYELYVTGEYDPGQSWPLIVFWHGILESGDDGVVHLSVGIATSLRDFPERYPCLVAMPQLPWNVTEEEAHTLFEAVIADVQARYNVDPDRISMTGLSYGASGTWHYAATHPGELSAILPVAGAGRNEDIPALLDIPIWTFSAMEDELGAASDWEQFVEDLEDAGANITATELPGSSHEIWDRVYRDQEIIDWLLSQSVAR